MQKYTEIPSSTTLTASLPLILQNDKTAISCHASTQPPTTNLQVGMLFYNTSSHELSVLVDATNKTWKVIADATGDARNLDGGAGNVIAYDKKNLNTWSSMPTGFYQGTNMTNAPSGDTTWRVLQIREGNSAGYASQMAFGANTGIVATRHQSNGVWSAWQTVYSGTSGAMIEGLNAEKVNGYAPSNAQNSIPISNGTVNTNLNADKVDGHDAGNKSGNIPINNGTVNTNLNADRVDGYHAGNASGQIAVNNGTLNTNLNAEMVGGVKVDNLFQLSEDGSFPRTITNGTFQLAKVNGTLTVDGKIVCKGKIVASNIAGKIQARTFKVSAGGYTITAKRDAYGRLLDLGFAKSDCNCDCNCNCDCGDSDSDGA